MAVIKVEKPDTSKLEMKRYCLIRTNHLFINQTNEAVKKDEVLWKFLYLLPDDSLFYCNFVQSLHKATKNEFLNVATFLRNILQTLVNSPSYSSLLELRIKILQYYFTICLQAKITFLSYPQCTRINNIPNLLRKVDQQIKETFVEAKNTNIRELDLLKDTSEIIMLLKMMQINQITIDKLRAFATCISPTTSKSLEYSLGKIIQMLPRDR